MASHLYAYDKKYIYITQVKIKKIKIKTPLCILNVTVTAQVQNFCGVGGTRVGVQVSMKELHTHIHLDHYRVESLYCINKNFKK